VIRSRDNPKTSDETTRTDVSGLDTVRVNAANYGTAGSHCRKKVVTSSSRDVPLAMRQRNASASWEWMSPGHYPVRRLQPGPS
jgi:hypothetical protein